MPILSISINKSNINDGYYGKQCDRGHKVALDMISCLDHKD